MEKPKGEKPDLICGSSRAICASGHCVRVDQDCKNCNNLVWFDCPYCPSYGQCSLLGQDKE